MNTDEGDEKAGLVKLWVNRYLGMISNNSSLMSYVWKRSGLFSLA
jgi:hypothetical protein